MIFCSVVHIQKCYFSQYIFVLFGELFKGLLSPLLPSLSTWKFKSTWRWLLTCCFPFPRCLANSHYSFDCPEAFASVVDVLCLFSGFVCHFIWCRQKQLLFLFSSCSHCFFFVKCSHCNCCRMNQVETWNAV